jgi:hypothetical protein
MTSADFPVVLVPIPGTQKGNIVEARQVHADCYRLTCKMHGYECDIVDDFGETPHDSGEPTHDFGEIEE